MKITHLFIRKPSFFWYEFMLLYMIRIHGWLPAAQSQWPARDHLCELTLCFIEPQNITNNVKHAESRPDVWRFELRITFFIAVSSHSWSTFIKHAVYARRHNCSKCSVILFLLQLLDLPFADDFNVCTYLKYRTSGNWSCFSKMLPDAIVDYR